ncbi:hypothetical protein ACWD4J_09915 [Streptomyces sp. NPDC002577]
MRNLARAAATAALAVSAVVIPLTGTAMAAPAQAPRAVQLNHDWDDDDCDYYGFRANDWDRYRNRCDDDCRYRWDRGYRSHWNNGYWRHHRNYGDCWWNYGRRYY